MVERYYYKEGNFLYFGFKYEKELVEAVKELPQVLYNPMNKEWYVELAIWKNEEILNFIRKFEFEEYRPQVVGNCPFPMIPVQEKFTLEEVAEAIEELHLKRKPRDYQIQGIHYILNHGNCINGDDCGLGKGQPYGSKVLSINGWVEIQNLKIGDKVCASDGKFYNVTGVFPKNEIDTYKFNFSDGSFFVVDEDHLHIVRTNNDRQRGRPWRVMSTKELLNCKNLRYGVGNKSRNYDLPIVSPIKFSKKEQKIHPYIMGCMLGDGSFRRIRFTSADKEIVERIRKLLPKGILLEQKSEIEYSFKTGWNKLAYHKKHWFREYFKELGLYGLKSQDKFIPENYLFSSVEDRIELLRGLMDTDGTISLGTSGYSTTSKRLKEDVLFLIRSLGGRPTVSHGIGSYKKNGIKKICSEGWGLTFSLKGINPFYLKRKAKFWNSFPRDNGLWIDKIEFEKKQKTVCISVDSPDNSYVTENLIVTHNTGQMIIVLELLDLFPCLIITPASVKYGWKKEWGKWTDREVNIIDTTNKVNVFDAPVNVINYDILGRKDKEKGSIDYVFKEIAKVNYKAAVWDEIHFAKNYKSIRGKISRKLARRLPAVFGLSGSLIMNRPEESINPLNIIKMFDVIFPSLQNFQLRYCNAKRTTFGVDLKGHHNVLELHDLLRNYCYIRREKREVLTELPHISSTVVDCGLTNTTQYHKAEKDLISYLQQVDVEKVEAAQRAEHLVKLSLLKTLVIKGKMKSIEIYIEEWLESNDNEKLVVFGTHREPLEKLAEKFNAPTLQGGLTAKKKMEIVEHFQVSDDRVIFCNIKAVGTGTDGLQEAASNIAFIELPDVYTDLEQAISRVERQGQKFSMNVAYLLCPDTIDTKLWNLLQNKKSVTDGVNKGIADESSINLELLKMYKV